MLKTTLLSLIILALAYVLLISWGDFQFEFLAVSYQVFKCCSQSECFPQYSRNVLLASILFTRQTYK